MENNSIYRERALEALYTKRDQTLTLPTMLSWRSITVGWVSLVAVLGLMTGMSLLRMETSVHYQPNATELIRNEDTWILIMTLPDNFRGISVNSAQVSIPALELFNVQVNSVPGNDPGVSISLDETSRRLYQTTPSDGLGVTLQFKSSFWQQLTSG